MTEPSTPLTQTEARTLAKRLTTETGVIHIATTVPLGCWGGTETGWDVLGPVAHLIRKGV